VPSLPAKVAAGAAAAAHAQTPTMVRQILMAMFVQTTQTIQAGVVAMMTMTSYHQKCAAHAVEVQEDDLKLLCRHLKPAADLSSPSLWIQNET